MQMKTWPDFNDKDDLPPGIHRASLAEVLEHLGVGTTQRRAVARRLERIYGLAVGSGHLARFIVFGSFVTTKPDPADVDIFLLMENTFDVEQLSGEVALIFDHAAAQNYEGASIFWIRRLAALDGEDATVGYWQIKRDGTKRGIVEVTKHDPK